MRIALDAMGGDFAPAEIVKGAAAASRILPAEIILVGDPVRLERELKKAGTKLPIVAASEVIGMNEPPIQSVKAKKDSSLNVAISLVKEKKADAVVSAGNTGALMAAALFNLGRVPGVERPAIATEFPAASGNVLLLDMGANVDCKPKHLQQFGVMGSLYAKNVLHIKNPRVGLLNIGEEKEKGNELTREAYTLLENSPINFIGNVEAKEILSGKADVFVCDGFIGNLILKFGETLGAQLFRMLRKEVSSGVLSRIGLLFLYPALKKFQKKISYDEHGGAPLLGINGIVFKAHGRARARAIMSALRETADAVSIDLVSCFGKMGQ